MTKYKEQFRNKVRPKKFKEYFRSEDDYPLSPGEITPAISPEDMASDEFVPEYDDLETEEEFPIEDNYDDYEDEEELSYEPMRYRRADRYARENSEKKNNTLSERYTPIYEKEKDKDYGKSNVGSGITPKLSKDKIDVSAEKANKESKSVKKNSNPGAGSTITSKQPKKSANSQFSNYKLKRSSIGSGIKGRIPNKAGGITSIKK